MILNYDNDRNKLHDIRRNFHFLLNVMEMAYDQEDHQTSMMIYLALIHPSVERLTFKRPKRTDTTLKKMYEVYGYSKTCYSKHVYDILQQDDIRYLPSLIVLSMFFNSKNKKAYRNMCHHLDDQMITELKNIIDIHGYMNLKSEHIIPLYTEDNNLDVYELSENIQYIGKPKALKRTRKQSIIWTENELCK